MVNFHRVAVAAILMLHSFAGYTQSIYDNITSHPKSTRVLWRCVAESCRFAPEGLYIEQSLISDGETFCEGDFGNVNGNVLRKLTLGQLTWDTDGEGWEYFIYSCGAEVEESDGDVVGFSWGYNFGFLLNEATTCSDTQLERNNTCYEIQDIKDKDSCPSSTGNENFILPSGQNSSSSVCFQKSDDSRCAYSLDQGGEFYIADFEGDCYSTAGTPFNEAGFTQVIGNHCQDIGNGVTACPESQDNVCNLATGVCMEGCGTVQFATGEQQFMCIDDDTDGDGIGDYADPDIDGDGIPNDADLDDDGDGIEEPDYSDSPANDVTVNGDISVSVDMSNLENLVSNTNDKLIDVGNKLEVIKEELGNQEGETFDGMNHTGELEGFYLAEYPNGWADVWSNNEVGFNQSAAIEYINSWSVSVSGDYVYPQFCIDVGIANLGCHTLAIDSRVFPFIRIVLIVSSLIVARQITVGG